MIVVNENGEPEMVYATDASAGFDIKAIEHVVIKPGKRAVVSTGLRLADSSRKKLPKSYWPELQIRPRSGLAAKHGVTVLNSPGTIDPDYKGEIKVILINHGEESFAINPGDKIAQGVFALVLIPFEATVSDRKRGDGGFGSTGV